MAEYSFPNYSSIFNQPSSYDWGSTESAGQSWQGQYSPDAPAIYTPQTSAPASTSWLDILSGVGVAADIAGNAIRAWRGEPRNTGGPYDQFMQAQLREKQDKEDKAYFSDLLSRYTKTNEEERQADPENLLERYRVLDPTKKMSLAGMITENGLGGSFSGTIPRLAGDIFSGRLSTLS